jgi:hypothetical protein
LIRSGESGKARKRVLVSLKMLTHHPKQRRIWRGVNIRQPAIDGETEKHEDFPPVAGRRRRTLGGQSEFRRHLIKERQHERDATISHKNHIYALDGRLAWSSVAPSQAPAFVEQIDRPKLTENVAREALMQYRDRTIEFIAPVALAAVIDEYAIFGPKSGDRLPSFLGVSLAEHLVEVAFDESLYPIRHSSLAHFR